MAAPTILGTACSSAASGTTITVTLPSWTAGDLALVFLTTDTTLRSWTSTGWTAVTEDKNNTLPSAAVFRRKLEAGDSDPVFTMDSTRAQQAIAVIIDDGTYSSDADPIDVATATDSWNEGTSATPQASTVTTLTDEALAFAVATIDAGASDGRSPYSVTTSGWTETHSSDCYTAWTSGLIVADKEIATASATGAVDFSLGASDQWTAAIIAVKPAAGASGVTVVLSGSAGTSQVGALVPAGGASISVTGVGGTGQVGVLVETGGASLSVTGVQGESALGALSVTGGAQISLTGVEGVGEVGTLTVVVAGGVTVSLTGVEGAGGVGDLSIAGGATLALDGVEGVSAVGALLAGSFTVVSLTGVSGSGSVGTLNLQTGATVGLDGVEGLSSAGAFDVTGGLSLTITGAESTGQVGTLAVSIAQFELITPSWRIYTIEQEDRVLLVVEDRISLVVH